MPPREIHPPAYKNKKVLTKYAKELDKVLLL
jgi:hypothetical protein